jgi:hypothetical protein
MLPLNSSKITLDATTKFLKFKGPLTFRRNLYFQHKEKRTINTGTTGSISDDIRDTPIMMS